MAAAEAVRVQGGECQGRVLLTYEYQIEGRGGVLRVVQRGMLGDDWEAEYEAVEGGWDMYLHTLAQYLAHFRGRTGTPVTVLRAQAGDRSRVWQLLKTEFGSVTDFTMGTRVRFAVPGLRPIAGVVDYLGPPSFLGVRTGDGLYRFMHSGPELGDVLVLGHHVFDDTTLPEEYERAWQGWLDGLPLT